MRGVIFNLLEEVVEAVHGSDTWDGLLDRAGLDGVYTAGGNYKDEELVRLVHEAALLTAQGEDAVLRWFGQHAIPLVAERFPAYFTASSSTLPFLRGVNDVIHQEVMKLYPGAMCPHFQLSDGPARTLRMIYNSPRRMCGLAHGFMLGVADYYGETLELTQPHCMHHGATQCVFEVATVGPAAAQ